MPRTERRRLWGRISGFKGSRMSGQPKRPDALAWMIAQSGYLTAGAIGNRPVQAGFSTILPFSPTMRGKPKRAFSARRRRATRRKARRAGPMKLSRERGLVPLFVALVYRG